MNEINCVFRHGFISKFVFPSSLKNFHEYRSIFRSMYFNLILTLYSKIDPHPKFQSCSPYRLFSNNVVSLRTFSTFSNLEIEMSKNPGLLDHSASRLYLFAPFFYLKVRLSAYLNSLR